MNTHDISNADYLTCLAYVLNCTCITAPSAFTVQSLPPALKPPLPAPSFCFPSTYTRPCWNCHAELNLKINPETTKTAGIVGLPPNWRLDRAKGTEIWSEKVPDFCPVWDQSVAIWSQTYHLWRVLSLDFATTSLSTAKQTEDGKITCFSWFLCNKLRWQICFRIGLILNNPGTSI